jgi:DedD protein
LALLEGKSNDPQTVKKAPVADAKAVAKPAANDDKAVAGKRFVVQAGSFSDKAAIRDARAKLERAGFKTYAQEISRDGKAITRVRVGPYPTEDEARKVLARIKSLGFKPGLLEI